jgi:3-oxoacyl-[acyl-carrier-protein] synthase II
VNRRLWVTGLGLVTPLGADVEATWAGLVRGQHAIAPVTLFDATDQRARLVAQVPNVTLPDGRPRRKASWSRSAAMALSAAREAMRSAHLDAREARVGLVVGGTTGGLFETEKLLARFHAEPASREPLVEMLSHPLTATGDRLQEMLGPFARVRTLSSACSSGANAIVVGAVWLQSGDVDAVVVGGSDGLCRLTLSGFNALGALDPEPCRPFDRRRRGTNLGEGAGFLVIESAERVRARGSTPVVELAGWAVGSEAHHITNPAPDGSTVAALIERAIARAGLTAADIDYVNAHGTATQLNDTMEAAALAAALGDQVSRVPVSSSKGQIGHTLGAAGAIEAVITALVVARSTLVPTAGLDQPDPAIGLVHVPHVGHKASRVRAAVSNAFGFGGMDTVLVFSEPDSAPRRGGSRLSVPLSLGSGGVPTAITGVGVFGSCGLLGGDDCAALLERSVSIDAAVDPDVHLDLERARRLDRTARLAAVAVERAAGAGDSTSGATGVILGSAFGNVDGSAAFMNRVLVKGPRCASPADFPNLVPSSLAGHVSIYGRYRGPAFATTDFAVSGESAFVQAAQLVAAGEAPRIVAGAAETASDIVGRVLGVLFADTASKVTGARVDLAAAIAVEALPEARRRGARVLAHVAQALEWRGNGRVAIEGLRSPRCEHAEVVLARADGGADDLLDRTSWRLRPRLLCAPVLGESDALGAVAVAVAAARIATAHIAEALVLGVSQARGYAIVLVSP